VIGQLELFFDLGVVFSFSFGGARGGQRPWTNCMRMFSVQRSGYR
jgi:hypothetical protein